MSQVRVMLSYDYNHFEVALSTEEYPDLTPNQLRKRAQRLCDEAVRQYQKAKEVAARRAGAEYERDRYLQEIARIEALDEADRTVRDLAMLKQYQDEEWEKQFEYEYDYEDDELPEEY